MEKKKRYRFRKVSLEDIGRNAHPLFIWVKVLVLADAAGNATRYGYDAEGRAVSVRGAAEALDRAYDAWGGPVLLAPHRGEGAGGPGDEMRWLRVAATGLVTNLVYSDGTCVSYAYAPDGRLLRRTDARGNATDYAYDADGNPTRIRTATGDRTVEWNAENRPVRFSSEYADDETGLVYYNWRHDNPAHFEDESWR